MSESNAPSEDLGSPAPEVLSSKRRSSKTLTRKVSGRKKSKVTFFVVLRYLVEELVTSYLGLRTLPLSRREVETTRHCYLRDVEKFFINAYSSFPKLDCFKILLSCEVASAAFSKFMMSIDMHEIFMLYKDITTLCVSEDYSNNPKKLAVAFSRFFICYIQMSDNIRYLLSEHIIQESYVFYRCDYAIEGYESHARDLCLRVQNEVIESLAERYFFQFLISRHYRNWRSTEASLALAASLENSTVVYLDSNNASVNGGHGINVNGHFPQGSGGTSLEISHPEQNYIIRSKQSKYQSLFVQRSRLNMDISLSIESTSRLFNSGNWLNVFLAGIEGLPVGFVVALPKGNCPIIFVNDYMLSSMGMQCSELHGKHCLDSFQDKSKPNLDGFRQLSNCVNRGVSGTHCLTISTVHEPQANFLVSVKGVYSNKRVYSFVLLMFVDVSGETTEEFESTKKGVVNLMGMLPVEFLVDHDDEEDGGSSSMWSKVAKSVSGMSNWLTAR